MDRELTQQEMDEISKEWFTPHAPEAKRWEEWWRKENRNLVSDEEGEWRPEDDYEPWQYEVVEKPTYCEDFLNYKEELIDGFDLENSCELNISNY